MINTEQIGEELAKVKDCKKMGNDNDVSGKSAEVPPKVYKISLFGRKSNDNSENNVVNVTEKMCSNQAMEESESSSESNNATTNVAIIQNSSEAATSIEAVPKDVHVNVCKEAVDTTVNSNDKSDNEAAQEVSLVFHQRKSVMTAVCDDPVLHKSAHTDINNNNNKREQNTGSETLSKTVFEGSESESRLRNSDKARLKSIEQVEKFKDSNICSNSNNSGKSKINDQVQSTEGPKTEPRTVSKASVYEALFKECVITKGFKTYGSDFPSKHPELCEAHVKQEPGLSECISIKQETNTKADDVSAEEDPKNQFKKSFEGNKPHIIDRSDITPGGDLYSNQTKHRIKRKVNDNTTLVQKAKKVKKSKNKIPKRLSVKNVPGNALFANFNEPTEVYTKPVSRKPSETIGLDVPLSTDVIEDSASIKKEYGEHCKDSLPKIARGRGRPRKAAMKNYQSQLTSLPKTNTIGLDVPMSTDVIVDSADIKKEHEEHCNVSLPKTARGRGRPRKMAVKPSQSQVSNLSKKVELKRLAKLKKDLSRPMADKLKIEPIDAYNAYEVLKQVSGEIQKPKQENSVVEKVSKYKLNGSRTSCKKKSWKVIDMYLGYTGKACLKASEKSCIKSVKAGSKRANSKYVKEAVASGSLFICKECGKWFSFHSHLENHRLLHSKDLPYRCLVCLRRFRLKYQIKRHTRRMHPEIELN